MSKRVVCAALSVAAIVHGLATTATASALQPVPEISPASISAGLAVLAGGVLLLRARRRK